MTPSRLILTGALAGLIGGCGGLPAAMRYERITVGGTTEPELNVDFPAPVRRNADGFVHYQRRGWADHIEQVALLALLGPDKTVAAKLYVRVTRQPMLVVEKRTTELQIDLASPLTAEAAPGPAGQVRALLGNLSARPYDKTVAAAYGLACAAVIRMLETMPGLSPSASQRQPLVEPLDWAVPDGRVQIRVADGRYLFEYLAERTDRPGRRSARGPGAQTGPMSRSVPTPARE